MEDGNNEDWWEEVESRSSLGWYQLTNEEFMVETYIGLSLGQEAIRCQFQISLGPRLSPPVFRGESLGPRLVPDEDRFSSLVCR